MPMSLRWLSHVTTSSLHAAEAWRLGETFADRRWHEVIAAPAENLVEEIRRHNLPESKFWRTILAFSSQFDIKRHLVKMALLRTYGMPMKADEYVTSVGGAIQALDSVVSAAFPLLADDLALRGRVLRDQWESRGPGMIAYLDNLLGENVIAPGADVVFVHPILGGGGAAQLLNNTVRIEAVLANPHERLPEVVRLAWMLVQLNLDVPIYGDAIRDERLPHVAALAMLPGVLEAAQQVELVQNDPSLLNFAAEAWRMYVPPQVSLADTLTSWWEEYKSSRPPLAVALQGLDEMLG